MGKKLKPISVELKFKDVEKPLYYFGISKIIWIVFLISSILVLTHYVRLILYKGFFDKEVIDFSIYIIIGSYFFLILDKSKIYEFFNIGKY